ncbi:glutathione S-transferase theta-1-like [Gouania willdenowi]|uniref:glutathione transferase n=1 Tax=Gouania willdenowi TaxID=441366 RepID=A0A8C5E1X0_GOUWI|nr:glutathione S-transferase theta-2B [Gouania willdenowi]
MELYVELFSQPCRSVFMVAKALGIPFELKNVELLEGQQYSEDFAKLSLVKKVPVMKDGNFVLTESVAILQYMVEKYCSTVADHWYPSDLQQRARVHEYLSWQHQNLRAHGSRMYQMRVFYPILMDVEVPEEKMSVAVEDLNESLYLLEEKFLQNKAFIVGDSISLADVVALAEIMQPVGSGLDVFEGRPKLTAWKERVKKAVGEKVFDEAHQKILNMGGMAQKMKNSPGLEMFKPKFKKLFI